MEHPVTTPPAPEPAPDASLSERVGKLETGQDSLSERIDRILGILDKKPEGDPPVTGADAPPPDITEQVKKAIRDVQAETPPPSPATPAPETPPREAGQPRRQRLAEVLYGREKK
jgi:hypothetical protein